MPGDYKFLLAQYPDIAFSSYSFLGNATSSLSGRISYFYDFNGPSLSLDTACSSSLIALHEACLNIQAEHCRAAIVGAVSLFSTPELFQFARRSNMSSTQGKCAAFGDEADGFIPAEGCASIVIMRYADAKERGLRIYGAILASGINHDGKSNGLMAPNAKSHGMLIKELYQRYGIDVARMAYIETHGTGTRLGDSIEMTGLTEAFRQIGGRYSCYLGAVKPLIGHTLVCSGLTGIIKILLSFRHKTIPPFPSITKPNELIDFSAFLMNDSPLAWPADKPLCAVSAFGFTGTNAHVVLKKMPPVQVSSTRRLQKQSLPFCFSAKNRNSFIKNLHLHRQLIEKISEKKLYDLSQLMLRRPRYEMHCVIVAASKPKLLSQLDRLVLDLPASAEISSDVLVDRKNENMSPEMQLLTFLWKSGDLITLRAKLNRLDSLSPDLDLPVYPFDAKHYWVDEKGLEQLSTGDETLKNQPKVLFEELRTSISALLGFPKEEIQQSTLIEDLGLDSLSTMALLAPYQKKEKIQAHELFKFKTLADFVTALAESRTKNENLSSSLTRTIKKTHKLKPVIQWISYGEGDSSIILALPLNTCAEAWTQQINVLLQSERSVLIPVYPGHKDNPFDATRFSLELMAEEIADFITQKLRGIAIDLVGWSLGGCLATLIAIKYPHLVRSLTLISTASSFSKDIFNNTLDLQDELKTHQDLLEIVFDGAEDILNCLSAGTAMNVLRYYYEELTQFDVNEFLQKITTKVLVIHGQNDCIIDEMSFNRLLTIPRAIPLGVVGHGHFIPLTASRLFNTELIRFLNSVDASG